ncbi:hypothetical protein SLEP1_g7432 [Rubroshorea leprosula]|uniref:Uncharacterized protein n=1 Tax=Rubroshorea leprosula TaxID=152421 RepID=A0AAV5HYK9_9ROSI|nr:hypothetical protein SLEP1_g7432 [Rubroshorea leprosula]
MASSLNPHSISAKGFEFQAQSWPHLHLQDATPILKTHHELVQRQKGSCENSHPANKSSSVSPVTYSIAMPNAKCQFTPTNANGGNKVPSFYRTPSPLYNHQLPTAIMHSSLIVFHNGFGNSEGSASRLHSEYV